MSNDAKEEKYFMEGNADELQRLAYQHQVIKAHLGKLILAPIDLSQPGMHILDSATADGLWLRDVRSQLDSSNRYVGIDIKPEYFPPQAEWPDNLTLQVQSITKPWPAEWANSFHFVHQRFALPAAGKDGIRDALRGLLGLVKPGGWIQLIEADHSVATGPAMRDMFALIEQVFAAMAVPHNVAKDMQTMLKDEGLQQVQGALFDVPLGAKNPDAQLGRKSAWAFLKGAEGLVGAAKAMPGAFASSHNVDALARNVKHELDQEGGVNRIYVAWGQKPYSS